MKKELQELVNEYRAATDAASAAKALILEAFEECGITSATAAYSDGVAVLETTVTYRKGKAEGEGKPLFDKEGFCADKTRAALYAAFCTKPSSARSATVSFTFKRVELEEAKEA